MTFIGGLVIGWATSNVCWWIYGQVQARQAALRFREALGDSEYRLDRAKRRAEHAEAALREAVCKLCHRQTGPGATRAGCDGRYHDGPLIG